ncbi:F-box protein [Carex littledalei]|uniref:F-box protein n=1 Tax=Carex littledalei TaxID=544730 RepID=A0A833VBK2_9POAL|nr:F-box protein [Carex littledalei]
MMENNNEATSSAALPQNELQGAARQGGTATATTSLRRSTRLQNKAASNLASQQKETPRGLATSSNQNSVRCRKKNKKTKNGVSLSMLPDDLLRDIMSRLPPKAFFRCKGVSKSLLELSTEAFRLNKHFRPTVSGLFHDTLSWHGDLRSNYAEVSAIASQEIDIDLKVLPRHRNMRIVDCCNGLLLVQAWNCQVHKHLYVYNPTTRNMLAAWSVPPPRDWWSFYEVFSLAFDPRVPSQFYIVCFRGWTHEGVDLNFFQTFSSKTGKWRSEKKLGSDCTIKIWNNGTFVGGKVYRLAAMNKIVSVDPSNNSLQVMQGPNIMNSLRPQIGQSRGYLHFITVAHETLQIWILNSQQHWILKHALRFNQVFGVPGYGLLNYEMFFTSLNVENPVALHPEEEVLFVPSARGNLMAFDLTTRRRRELCNLPRTSLLVFWVYMPCYLI